VLDGDMGGTFMIEPLIDGCAGNKLIYLPRHQHATSSTRIPSPPRPSAELADFMVVQPRRAQRWWRIAKDGVRGEVPYRMVLTAALRLRAAPSTPSRPVADGSMIFFPEGGGHGAAAPRRRCRCASTTDCAVAEFTLPSWRAGGVRGSSWRTPDGNSP
jgi:hypothetical protein